MTYTNSENNGSIQGLFACDPNGKLQPLCQATLDKQAGDFYAIASGDVEDPVSKLKQWQLINTTTWDVDADFTVKNILFYADLKQSMRGSTFGTDFVFPDAMPFGLAGSHLLFLPAQLWPGTPTNSQTTFVEELRFQGVSLGSKLNWQAGLYFENSKPDGVSGASAPGFIVCPASGLGNNPATWNCNDPLSVFASALGLSGFSGAVQSNVGTIEYLNEAIYSQATYDITDEFRVTGGLRYTVDTTKGESQQILYSGFPAFPPAGGPNPITGQCVIGAADANCNYHTKQKSEAPTWLVDFDYLPTPDTMYYAKYARGYRQGSVNIFGPEGLQTFEPEKVNAYEIGSKNSFHGSIPGTFNISAFYNELSNQQIQANYLPDGHGTATTAILNAGSSTIQGVEVETMLRLLKDLSFNFSYTYLQTKLNQLNQPTLYSSSLIQYQQPIAAAEEGGHLSFSPRHTVSTALSYRLPVSADLGDISVGGSYIYVGDQVSTNSPTYGTLPSHHLVNLNLDWKNIAGSNFDASMFATNVTREKYVTYVPGLYDQSGMEFRVVGEPRMFGARVKYNFGQ